MIEPFDRIQQAGGFVSVNTSGNTIDANSIPVPKDDADKAFEAAACIGCGACVATCKNGSAMLFVGAKYHNMLYYHKVKVESYATCFKHGTSNGRRRIRKLYKYWSM